MTPIEQKHLYKDYQNELVDRLVYKTNSSENKAKIKLAQEKLLGMIRKLEVEIQRLDAEFMGEWREEQNRIYHNFSKDTFLADEMKNGGNHFSKRIAADLEQYNDM
jgi:hypothetical protein